MPITEVFSQNHVLIFLDTLILYIQFFIIKIKSFQGNLSKNTAKTAAMMPILAMCSCKQCFLFSRIIGWVTPKINYFHYIKKYFLAQSIQIIFYLILKKEALVARQVVAMLK